LTVTQPAGHRKLDGTTAWTTSTNRLLLMLRLIIARPVLDLPLLSRRRRYRACAALSLRLCSTALASADRKRLALCLTNWDR
jgi:hypothetical protein